LGIIASQIYVGIELESRAQIYAAATLCKVTYCEAEKRFKGTPNLNIFSLSNFTTMKFRLADA